MAKGRVVSTSFESDFGSAFVLVGLTVLTIVVVGESSNPAFLKRSPSSLNEGTMGDFSLSILNLVALPVSPLSTGAEV